MAENIKYPKYVCAIHKTPMDVIVLKDQEGYEFRCDECRKSLTPSRG